MRFLLINWQNAKIFSVHLYAYRLAAEVIKNCEKNELKIVQKEDQKYFLFIKVKNKWQKNILNIFNVMHNIARGDTNVV